MHGLWVTGCTRTLVSLLAGVSTRAMIVSNQSNYFNYLWLPAYSSIPAYESHLLVSVNPDGSLGRPYGHRYC